MKRPLSLILTTTLLISGTLKAQEKLLKDSVSIANETLKKASSEKLIPPLECQKTENLFTIPPCADQKLMTLSASSCAFPKLPPLKTSCYKEKKDKEFILNVPSYPNDIKVVMTPPCPSTPYEIVLYFHGYNYPNENASQYYKNNLQAFNTPRCGQILIAPMSRHIASEKKWNCDFKNPELFPKKFESILEEIQNALPLKDLKSAPITIANHSGGIYPTLALLAKFTEKEARENPTAKRIKHILNYDSFYVGDSPTVGSSKSQKQTLKDYQKMWPEIPIDVYYLKNGSNQEYIKNYTQDKTIGKNIRFISREYSENGHFNVLIKNFLKEQ